MSEMIIDNNILFFAFRYALGRKSTAPSMVITAILRNLKNIEDIDIERYIKEISNCNDFGMEIDKKNWISLKKDLEMELELRKTLAPKYNIHE